MVAGRSYFVTDKHLNHLKEWFFRHVRSFYSTDPLIQQAVKLKEDHSLRVCDEIRNIGRRLELSSGGLMLAEVMALLHDVGRFKQVARYRTFADGNSENHGELGVKVLKKENALALFDDKTRELIFKAVAYHNRMTVPEDESPECIYFTNLLRDADKIDIFHLLADYYYAPPEERNAAVEFELPDTPTVSDDVLACLQKGKMIKIKQLQSLNDFKLLQMAWIYDINFQPTFQIVHERGYIERIRNTMPALEKIDEVYKRIALDLQRSSEAANNQSSLAL